MAKRKSATKQTAPIETREIRAVEAKLAQLRGQSLTRQQERDLAWYEASQSEAAVNRWSESVPKGDYCRLSGRQHKLIDDAARNYDLPIGEATIDLQDALTALHDLVASNASRIRSVNVDGDRVELEEEKLRQQIAKLATENDRLQIALDRDRGDAITRQELREALNSIAATMREHGRAFARISAEARDLWNQVCDSLAEEIESGQLKF